MTPSATTAAVRPASARSTQFAFELDPNNSHVPQTRNMPSMANPAQNLKTCVMLLRCFYDESLPDPQNEPDPTVANNPEATPVIIA